MYSASVGKRQIKKTLAIIVGVAVLAAAGIAIAKGGKKDEGAAPGASDEQRVSYLLERGIQTDLQSTVAQVRVPEEFDERFTEYNEMLKADGFDLEPLRGENVLKCSYSVTNSGAPQGLKAILLVKDGVIAGGHIVNEGTGELFPLSYFGSSGGSSGDGAEEDEETAQETLLPEPQAAQGEEEAQLEEIPASAFPTD
ncbi:MAG: DUF4830 domain-containing protein [Oscillospiraceae bacterium]|nr:DUF4830 domain-containing protein [Oscillospiraceae bacterium]